MIRVRIGFSRCILLILIGSLLSPVLAGGTGVGLEDVNNPVKPISHTAPQTPVEPESGGNVSINNSISNMSIEGTTTLGDLIRSGDLDAVEAFQKKRMNESFNLPVQDLPVEQESTPVSEHEQTTRIYVIRYPCP